MKFYNSELKTETERSKYFFTILNFLSLKEKREDLKKDMLVFTLSLYYMNVLSTLVSNIVFLEEAFA